MIAFRPFTKDDWQGLAGAAPFELRGFKSAEPLVAELEVDDVSALAALDADGLVVMFDRVVEDRDDDADSIEVRWSGGLAGRAALLLTPSMTFDELTTLPGAVSS